MLAISAMIEVHSEFTEKYREAALRHAANCLANEKGCLQFSVQQHSDNPARFFFYEVYETLADFEEIHGTTPYMQEFRELTAPWIKARQLDRWIVQKDARRQ